ncbi:MAG: DUF2730 family protein [Gemmobacter sp.]
MTQPLDIAPAIVWIIALSQLLTFGLTIWNLMSAGGRDMAKRIDSHAHRLADHDMRLAGIEQMLRQVPAQGDFHALQLSLSEMRGDLREMRAIMGRMENIVSRHEDHLLKG